MNRGLVTLGVALMVGCGGTTQEQKPEPQQPTAFQVDAYIHLTEWSDGSRTLTWDVKPFFEGSRDSGCLVVVNNTVVPDSCERLGFPACGEHHLESRWPYVGPTPDPITYDPGLDLTVAVQRYGTTYSATMKAPGGITIDADGSFVSWTDTAIDQEVEVKSRAGTTTTTTWSTHAIGTSMHIPDSAYPSPGTYTVVVSLWAIMKNESDQEHFGPTWGSNAKYWIKNDSFRTVVR